ncbi:MAG: hypothetical protein RL094_551 [Candidatus Parcubacteria bacterium]|jgi:UPF0755 protein
MQPRKRRAGTPAPASTIWKISALVLVSIFTILLVGGTVSLSKLGLEPWRFYLNVANPNVTFVSIQAGLRKEQIAEILSKQLSWPESEKGAFMAAAAKRDKQNPEGVFLPGNYWVYKTATGEQVANQMIDAFYSKVKQNILNKDQTNFKDKMNLATAVKIASILQREAAGPEDMKIISGVIWNRLFRGMTLDMDATLQYSKGAPGDWWPKVASSDKRLESQFNTYKFKGLPPTAIANPSLDALYAAYNPSSTDCIFYIHDAKRNFHCSVTYEEHKQNISTYLIGKKPTPSSL